MQQSQKCPTTLKTGHICNKEISGIIIIEVHCPYCYAIMFPFPYLQRKVGNLNNEKWREHEDNMGQVKSVIYDPFQNHLF